jgi:hypothetical protein
MLDFVRVPDFHMFLVNGGARCSDWCRCWFRRGYFTKEERAQGLDCGELIGRGFLYSFNRRSEACSGIEDPVSGRDLGDRDGMVIVSEGVGDALATNVGHQNLDAAVVVWRVGEIPSFGGVVSPRAASVGFHVDENLRAEGSHGSCVEREGAFERFVGGGGGSDNTGGAC